MLELIRKLKSSIVGLGIVFICVILMMQFGIGRASKKGAGQHPFAAMVDGQEISFEKFYQRRQVIESNLRARLGKSYDQFRSFIRLDEQAIDSLVNDILVNEFTNGLGLTISTQQIEDEIRHDPFFAGDFTKDKYQTYLAAYGMTGVALEKIKRQELIGKQLQGIFRDLQFVTDNELKALFVEKNTKVGFQYLTLNAKDFVEKVDTSNEQALQDYFNDNKAKYRIPRAIRYSVLEFDPLSFQSQVEVSDEDAQLAYDARQGDFREPKKFRLSRIVLKKEKAKDSNPVEDLVLGDEKKKDPNSDPSATANKAKRAKAEQLLKDLEEGKDFSQLAKENSEDSETKDKGGDWGWKTYGDIGPKRSQAIASLGNGENSQVIDTDDSFEIVKVDEVVESRVKPFAEVRDVVVADLRATQAPVYARAEADQFLSALQEAKLGGKTSLIEFAKGKGKTAIETSHLLTAEEGSDGSPTGLTKQIINRSVGDVDIVEVNDKNYLFEVIEVREAADPEFAAVKDQVISDYKQAQSVILAKQEAEKMLGEISAQGSTNSENATKNPLVGYAEQHKLGLKTVAPEKIDTTNSEIFANPDIKRKAFSLTETSPILKDIVSAGNQFFIVAITERQLPDTAEFEGKKKELRKQAEEQAASRIQEALIKELRSRAIIDINPSITGDQQKTESL